jgi:hypothetical protein
MGAALDFASTGSSSAVEVISAVPPQPLAGGTQPELPMSTTLSGDNRLIGGELPDSAPYWVVMRSPSELHPHPSWVKHNLRLSVARLSAIAASWSPSKLDPVSITRDGTILKGYEVCELARRMGLEQVSCFEYDLDEAEALLWIIQHSHKDEGLNSYHRIVLALDYELSFRERARRNQRLGGKFKGSTTLSEAQTIDCR